MAGALEVLNEARKQIGFVEGANNENPYGSWYGLPNEPYCAMGVSWCFAQAGLSALVAAQTSKGFAYCPAGLSWFQRNKQIVGKYDGQPGDIVFFSWAGNGVADHVEIIEAASRDGITTIGFNTTDEHSGGNQANGGGCYRRHRSYLYVLAIARPNYPNAVKPTTAMRTNPKIAAGVAGATAVAGGGMAATHQKTTIPTPSPTVYVAPPFPKSAFDIGTKSPAVLAVEQALVKAGLLTNPTGTYSQADENAVLAWQKRHTALNQKGVVDEKTYNSLMTEFK